MKIWRLLSVALLMFVSSASSGGSRSEAVTIATLPAVIATVNVGSTPRGIGVDEGRNLVYVSNSLETGDNRVTKIDGATLTPSVFSQAVSNPIGVAVNSGANRVLVVNNDQPLLSVLKGEDGTLYSTPTVGSNSFGIAFNASTGKAYVASYNSGAVYRVNTADDNVKTIEVPGNPVWVALNPGLQRAYVTLQGTATVGVIDTATDELIGQYSGSFGTVAGIAVNTATGDIFVVNAFQGGVTVLDMNGNFKGALDVGKNEPFGQPRGVVVNPNTGHVFVTRFDDNKVYVFDAASVGGGAWLSSFTQLSVGAGPELGMAINTVTNRVYVANMNSNTVSVISDLPKTMQLGKSSLSFASRRNGSPPSQSVQISDAYGDSWAWTSGISYDNGDNWLTANPPSGAAVPVTVDVGVNTAPSGTALNPGTYTGRVTFSSAEVINSPQNVNVTLVISNDLTMQLSTNNVAFLTVPGGTPSTQTVVVSDAYGDTWAWTRSISYTDGSGWLSASPVSGAGTPVTANIGVDTTSLALGTYRGKVTFTASTPGVVNSPQDVNVTLVITDGANISKTYLPVVAKAFAGAW